MAETDAERVWLERELAELRARESEYRKRLGRNEALETRLHAHLQSVHQLFRRRPPSRNEFQRTLVDVARISAQALAIRRTSVWTLDRARQHLNCVLQLVDGEVVAVSGLSLSTASSPRYMEALAQEFALAVSEVYEDPRTVELTSYLREHGIGALLDIPIAVPGTLLGVVCHEHLEGTRIWQRREIDFASSVSQLVALALETERRVSAELTARGTQAKYKHLVESLPVTVYSFDVHTGKLEYVSPRISELGAYSAEDWVALGAGAWIRHIHPDDRTPVLQRFQRGAAGGFPEEVTYRLQLPTGTRWVRDTCRVVRNHTGEPLAIQGVLVDVTAQTEAELSRMEFERRYRSLLENVDLVAVSLDTAGQVTFANDAFVRVSGYGRDELLGKNWFDLMLPESERESVKQRYLNDVANGTVAPRFELAILTREGETRRILCTNTVLRSPDGTPTGASSLALDVTDRRKLEQELLQQTKLESLGRLAAGVAHDFNNLLTVMLAQIELIKRSVYVQTNDNLEGQFAAMDQVIEQACELTRSLLAYGRRSQAGQTEILSLDTLVRESLPLLEAIAGQEIQVTTSLHADDAQLKMDRARVRQVLVNLVGNAADATRDHGHLIHIATHVELVEQALALENGAQAGGEFAVLTVADDGRGMDAALLDRIFDPFFTTKSDGRGTGLGLAIAQSVVGQMGGFTKVESTPSVGTSFRIYLPLKPARVSLTGQRASPPDVTKLVPHVLVVEGRRDLREAIARALGRAGYDVISASNMRSAAEALASDSIDLLITGHYLPDGSGAVLARSARSIRPSLRTLLVSKDAEDDEAFDAVLQEPFGEERLIEATRGLLNGGTRATHP